MRRIPLTICCTILVLLLARGPCELRRRRKRHGWRLHIFLFHVGHLNTDLSNRRFLKTIRTEVAAEAREGRLPLGQVFESCKYREVGDPPRCKNIMS